MDAFWNNVGKTDMCWEWQGYIRSDGYGQFSFLGKHWLAHRMAFLLANGRDAYPGCLHKCDNKKCCRPDHLEEGDQRKNLRDAATRNLLWMTKVTHCPSEHEYTPENTYLLKGRRNCKLCARVRSREYQRSKRMRRKLEVVNAR